MGYVTDINSHFSKTSQEIESEVFAIVHTKAFSESKKVKGSEVLEKLVKQGLRATLDSTIPMIGSDYINLVFDKSTIGTITKNGNFDLFPSIQKTRSSNLLDDTQKLIQKIEKLPLEQLLVSADKLLKENNTPIKDLLQDLRKTVNSVNTLVKNFDKTASNLNTITKQKSLQELPEQLTITLQELTTTLEKVQTLSQDYGANSKFASELSLTLRELTLTAESMGRISLKLEKKPNALILGDN